jgi:hypothetical protein
MMTPGTILYAIHNGRPFTVVKKTKPKNGYLGGVKVIHLKAGHIEMSVRVDLIEVYFREGQ